jgi:hypothetical protein
MRCVHLHHDLIRLNAWLPHGVLPIHGGPRVGCMLQEQVIEGRPDDVVGKGWLEGRLLKGKREDTSPFMFIVERRPRLGQEAGLA